MAEADLGLIDDPSLHHDVVGLGRELARLSLVFAQHVREWEQRGIFERDGSKSSAHRLAREMKSSLGDRRIDVRRARRIDDLPNVVAYVKRIEQRTAYRKAMEIAGPHARGGAAALGFAAARH